MVNLVLAAFLVAHAALGGAAMASTHGSAHEIGDAIAASIEWRRRRR